MGHTMGELYPFWGRVTPNADHGFHRLFKYLMFA